MWQLLTPPVLVTNADTCSSLCHKKEVLLCLKRCSSSLGEIHPPPRAADVAAVKRELPPDPLTAFGVNW